MNGYPGSNSTPPGLRTGSTPPTIHPTGEVSASLPMRAPIPAASGQSVSGCALVIAADPPIQLFQEQVAPEFRPRGVFVLVRGHKHIPHIHYQARSSRGTAV